MRNPFHPPYDPEFDFEPQVETMAFALNSRTGADIVTITNVHDGVRYAFERVPENPADDCRWWCVAYVDPKQGFAKHALVAFDPDETFPIADDACLWMEKQWEDRLPYRPSPN